MSKNRVKTEQFVLTLQEQIKKTSSLNKSRLKQLCYDLENQDGVDVQEIKSNGTDKKEL